MNDRKAYMRKWRSEHPEKVRASCKKWRAKHPEKVKEAYKKWRATHLKEINAYNKKWQATHPEQTKASRRKWYAMHRKEKLARGAEYDARHSEQVKKRIAKYLQSPKGKKAKAKHDAKRKKLGYTLLNKRFAGSEKHHIDSERIIYIPKKMHKSIRHSVLQNRNMIAINTLAFNWLETECKRHGSL